MLVIGIGPNVGRTTLSATLAMTLSHVTKKSTAYTQQPSPASLVSIFNVEPGQQSHKHAAGFDLMLQQEAAGVPMTARATLALDRLVTQYENAIISLSDDAEELIDYFAAHADQIIFVLMPEPEKWEELNKAQARLRSLIRPEKVGLFVVVNRTKPEHATMRTMGRADFDLPYKSTLTPLATMTMDSRSAAIAAMTNAIADRLGRANQVSLFIPTTVDVDKAVDTSIDVQRTLEFLGSRFGGATTNEARGVWNSADSGLVAETIHIVKSYATQHDLDTHLQEILNYVEQMKAELKQEAMAVEINQKLMLI